MISETDTLLNACRAAFPRRENLSVQSVNPLEGNRHEMTAFRLAWADAGGQVESLPLILRRYPGAPGWHAFDDPGRAEREFNVLRFLGANQLPVPPALAHGADDQGSWLLEGALHGRNWWQPMGGVNFNAVLPGLVRQQVALLTRLHSLDPGELASRIPTITAAGVLDVYDQAARASDDALVVAVLRRVREILSGVEERPPRLIHGDAELTNLLVDDHNEVVGWLDWDDTALGDPRWDVAALFTSLRGGYQMPELAQRAVADYGKAAVYPVRELIAWVAVLGVLRWAQCAWLMAQAKAGRRAEFPARARFVEAYDSHRAWAMEMLQEAEANE